MAGDRYRCLSVPCLLILISNEWLVSKVVIEWLGALPCFGDSPLFLGFDFTFYFLGAGKLDASCIRLLISASIGPQSTPSSAALDFMPK